MSRKGVAMARWCEQQLETDSERWAACVAMLLGPHLAGDDAAERMRQARLLAVAALTAAGETQLAAAVGRRLDHQ